MKSLKLLVENEINDYQVILEQESKNKPEILKIKGPYIITEMKNANGRIYKDTVMEKCVNDYTNDFISTCRALGELNHPDHTEINPDRACHRIISLERFKDGKTSGWLGESIILKGTPCGDIVSAIIKYGGKPGVSTRGVGNITESGIVDEYKLVTIDVVTNPSGPGCFVNGILESKNYMINQYGDIVENAYTKLIKGLSNIPTHNTHTDIGKEHVQRILTEFIRSI